MQRDLARPSEHNPLPRHPQSWRVVRIPSLVVDKVTPPNPTRNPKPETLESWGQP